MYTFYVCFYGLVSSDSFFVIITCFFFFNIHSLIWSTKTINKHIYFNMVNCVPLFPLPKNFPRDVCCAPFTYSFPWCLCPLFLLKWWCKMMFVPKTPEMCAPFPFPFFLWNESPYSLFFLKCVSTFPIFEFPLWMAITNIRNHGEIL